MVGIRLSWVALAITAAVVPGVLPSTAAAAAVIAGGSDPTEVGVRPGLPDIVRVAVRHDRRPGRLVVAMRFRDALQESYSTIYGNGVLLQWTLWPTAGGCVGRFPQPGNVNVEAHFLRRGSGANYYIDPDPPGPSTGPFEYSEARFSLSRDRRVARVRLSNDYLRRRTYVQACASVTAKFDPTGFGPEGIVDEATAFFEVPLHRVRARVDVERGQLGVRSVFAARGARIAIRILRRGRLVARRVLRQSVDSDRIREPLKLRCREGARYQVRIRARDRYGNRRLLVHDRVCR